MGLRPRPRQSAAAASPGPGPAAPGGGRPVSAAALRAALALSGVRAAGGLARRGRVTGPRGPGRRPGPDELLSVTALSTESRLGAFHTGSTDF